MERAEVTIRPEAPDDHLAIRRVVAAAFGSDSEAELVGAIRSSRHYVAEMSLVAASDGVVVGHVMISGATLRSERGDAPIVMLAPLAVAPDRQRTGVGSALVRAACAVAEDRGEPMIVLEGDPAYYGRFGFEPSYEYGIELPLPDWASREAGQVLRLSAWDPSLAGTVVYPETFDAFAELWWRLEPLVGGAPNSRLIRALRSTLQRCVGPPCLSLAFSSGLVP
jgi:putative acetyltransferase